MKSLVKIAAAVLLCLACLTLTASAQNVGAKLGSQNTLWSSASYTASTPVNTYCGTNNVSLNTNVVDLSSFQLVGLTWNSQLTGAGTTTNTVLVERSTDGSYWDSYDRIITTSSGTTVVGYNTNYAIGGIGKLRFTVLTSAAGTAPLTNSTLTILLKHNNQ